ncbi:MAG: DUF6850 family outer membrane beta-barrel protein [Bacteroidota bacterium]
MQINLKRKILFILLLAACYPGFAGDTLHVKSFNTFRLVKSYNSWLETGNIAGLVYNQPTNSVSSEAGFDKRDGDYHRIMEGNEINDYSFSTESFQSQKKRIFLYGKFAFYSVDETGGQWNGTYDPYNGNPYILADSLSGTTYHKENYNLVGGVGYKLNDRISLGAGVDYYVGVAAKQKDPRPLNTYMRFKFNPSLILTTTNYKLGFDIGYKSLKEEIDYTVKRLNFDPTFFAFKGFGFYTRDIGISYYRLLTVNEFFGGVQFEKKLKKVPTLTELRFNYDVEGIEDGGSEIRKLDGGDWRTYCATLKEQINYRKGFTRHSFTGVFSFFNGDGNEISQSIIHEGTSNVSTYVTTGINLKFNRQTISGTVSYNYLKLKDQDRIDWDVTAGVNFLNNSEQYFYIPEIFSSGYANVTGNLSLQKNLYFGKCHLALSLNSGYTLNLSNDLQLSTLPEITKKQRKDVYRQEFDYYASSVMKTGGEVKIGGNFLNIKNLDQVYLGFSYDQVNQIGGNKNFNMICTRIGFVF